MTYTIYLGLIILKIYIENKIYINRESLQFDCIDTGLGVMI